MKWYVPALLALLLTASTGFAADKATLKTDEQKFSYAMGMDLGKDLKSLEEKFDLNLLQKGINDGYSGEKQLLTDEEAMTIQQDFAKRQREKQIKKTVETIQKNRKEADDFLSANMKKEGVQATKSGLQYKVITMGTGSKPKPEDKVKVNYKGKTIKDEEFDSSYKRNEPAEFQVDQVIQGWQEALPLMPVGSTFELFIPPDLAYGDRGAPPVIEPGSLLIFEVQLLDIVKDQPNAEKKDEAKPVEKK